MLDKSTGSVTKGPAFKRSYLEEPEMRGTWLVGAFFAAVILVSSTVSAHHGANLFDTTKAVVLKGTVTKFEWGTPHNQIFFDVKDEKSGELKHWVASTEPAPVMLERGWTRRSLKEGDQVEIVNFVGGG